MRPGLIASTAAHALILAWGIVNLGTAKPYEVAPTESLPIEILTPQEFEAMTKGSKTSKKVEAPKVKAEKLAAVDLEPKDDALPVQKEDVDAAPPPAPESPKAEVPPPPPPTPTPAPPKPEPVKAEPKPAPTPVPTPEPAPKQAEKKPEPPKPEPPKEEPKKAEAAKPEPVKEAAKPEKPKDQPKPEPVKEKAPEKPKSEKVETAKKTEKTEPSERKFDVTKIAALLDKRAPGRTEVAARETAPETTAGTSRGVASKLSLSQKSGVDNAVIEQVKPCWNPPVGASGADALVVRVSFTLNPDGSLSDGPTVMNTSSNPAFRAAAGAATRAVQRCTPLKLPADAFDYWGRGISINFDPKEMLGG